MEVHSIFLSIELVAPAILSTAPFPMDAVRTGSGHAHSTASNPLIWRRVTSSAEPLIRTGDGCLERAKAERAGRRLLVLGSGVPEKVEQLGQVSV